MTYIIDLYREIKITFLIIIVLENYFLGLKNIHKKTIGHAEK